jgi:hypothetical protein
MDEAQIEVIEETPMGDDSIHEYFPGAKIIKYSELNNIKSIDELLPKNKSYFFMLIEDSPSKGHWVAVNRINDELEFFDSYGGQPDSQLKWIGMEERVGLGQASKRLTELFKDSGMEVNYNPVKYQEKGDDIQTCGRHCCLRIKMMLEGKDLDAYNNYMEALKHSSGMNYDEIASFFINRT